MAPDLGLDGQRADPGAAGGPSGTAGHPEDLGAAEPADAGVCHQCGLPTGRRPVHAIAGGFDRVYCCTGCHWVAQLIGEPGERAAVRGFVLRLGLAIFFALNAMVFSLAHYGNLLGGDRSLPAERLMDVQRWAQLVFTLPVFLILGLPTLLRVTDIARGRPAGLDGLVALGAGAALILSTANTLAGRGEVYFDTVNMLLILVTLGKALEATARARATRHWSQLQEEIADDYTVTRGGGDSPPAEEARPAANLRLAADAILVGDAVRVEAGQTVPVDGTIADGRALVRSDWLTGESRPRELGPGDEVLAGFTPLDGAVTVLTAAVGRERRRERLRVLLEEARAARPALVRLGDRLSSWLLPLTLGVAALAFLLGWHHAGFAEALRRSVAVLVVACPCAMGIAAPLAFWNAWAAPAAQGIWLASADVVERLATIQRVAYDKTGTLTEPQPSLLRVDLVPDPKELQAPAASGASTEPGPGIELPHWTQARVLAAVAGLEREIPHPLAASLAAFAAPEDAAAVRDVRLHAGLGVEGTLDGHHLLFGSRRFLERRGVRGLWTDTTDDAPLHLACEGTHVATLALGESIRFGSGPAVRGLRSLGVEVILLSGDEPARTLDLARTLGIDHARGGLLPEQKLTTLRELMNQGPAAMVGDGMNDAPALAASTVGVALGRAADLTRSAADVTAPAASPAVVPALIRHARRARRVVRQNFTWAIGYNGIALLLAAGGRLHPIAAAALMLLSSLTVIASSRRTAFFPRLPVAQDPMP